MGTTKILQQNTKLLDKLINFSRTTDKTKIQRVLSPTIRQGFSELNKKLHEKQELKIELEGLAKQESDVEMKELIHEEIKQVKTESMEAVDNLMHFVEEDLYPYLMSEKQLNSLQNLKIENEVKINRMLQKY